MFNLKPWEELLNTIITRLLTEEALTTVAFGLYLTQMLNTQPENPYILATFGLLLVIIFSIYITGR